MSGVLARKACGSPGTRKPRCTPPAPRFFSAEASPSFSKKSARPPPSSCDDRLVEALAEVEGVPGRGEERGQHVALLAGQPGEDPLQAVPGRQLLHEGQPGPQDASLDADHGTPPRYRVSVTLLSPRGCRGRARACGRARPRRAARARPRRAARATPECPPAGAGRRAPGARMPRVVGDRDELRVALARAARRAAARSGEHAARGRDHERREAAVDHRHRPVQQVGGRVGLRDEVARLLHLERHLEGGRVVEAAPHHHEVLGIAVAGDLVVERRRSARSPRRRGRGRRPSSAQRAALALERRAQHGERAELRRCRSWSPRPRARRRRGAAARARRPRASGEPGSFVMASVSDAVAPAGLEHRHDVRASGPTGSRRSRARPRARAPRRRR